MRQLSCTISGSFHRFLNEIAAKTEQLRLCGVTVHSPQTTTTVGEVNGFVLLQGDSGTPAELEKAHLAAIDKSDFLYVVNPGGYIGPSSTLEIGYAVARSISVVCSDAPLDPVISYFSTIEPSVSDLVRRLENEKSLAPPSKGTLPQLQIYIEQIVKARGFDDENIRDVVLLLVEEVGELSKAVRQLVGLKISASSNRKKALSHELADCLIYLLDIANLGRIDLETAFQEKEAINSAKYPSL